MLVLVVGAAVGQWYILADREDAPLRAKYGRDHYSEGPEEWIVRDFFQDRRGGVYLDVGASEPRLGSNTYFLESSLGWSGIAVDAIAEYAPQYAEHRPQTRFFPFFVGDRSDAQATLFVVASRPNVSSSDPVFVSEHARGEASARQVPTITLNDLLVKAGIDRIDFVSMDIELAEPQALAGFDIDRFKPALVCIEAHPDVRQQILDYFAQHGYVVIGKYLRADSKNLYFHPVHAAAPDASTR